MCFVLALQYSKGRENRRGRTEPGQNRPFPAISDTLHQKRGNIRFSPVLRYMARKRPENGQISTLPWRRSKRHAHTRTRAGIMHRRTNGRTRTPPGPERTHDASTHTHTRTSAHVHEPRDKWTNNPGETLHLRNGRGLSEPARAGAELT